MMGDGESETCSEMSQLTVDSTFRLQEQTSSNLDGGEVEASSKEWTNEKHYLYIKSLEASFVKELHRSMSLRRGQAQKDRMRKCWKYIRVSENGCKSVVFTNPWIRHFKRTTGKLQVVEATISQEMDFNAEVDCERKEYLVSDVNSRQSRTALSRQDSIGSNIEVSDQNFADNDESTGTCSIRRAKRKMAGANNNVDSDQVVPKDRTTATSDHKRMALYHK